MVERRFDPAAVGANRRKDGRRRANRLERNEERRIEPRPHGDGSSALGRKRKPTRVIALIVEEKREKKSQEDQRRDYDSGENRRRLQRLRNADELARPQGNADKSCDRFERTEFFALERSCSRRLEDHHRVHASPARDRYRHR